MTNHVFELHLTSLFDASISMENIMNTDAVKMHVKLSSPLRLLIFWLMKQISFLKKITFKIFW